MSGISGYDVLWADSTAQRWMMNNHAHGPVQVVASGIDINTADQVIGINGAAVAVSLPVLATNSSKQIVTATTTGSGATVVLATSPAISQPAITHPLGAGSPATNNTCGSAPTFAGNDSAGRLTLNTASLLSCTITFAASWSNAPVCVATDTSNPRNMAVTTTTTTMTMTTASAYVSTDVLAWLCVGF